MMGIPAASALRSRTAAFALGAMIALELLALSLGLPAVPAQVDYLAAVYPKVLVAFANDARRRENVGRLLMNPVLSEAARLKAEDMAAKDYFAHVSPDGTEPWDWFRKVGYRYRAAGENLAVNYRDSDALHRAWMESPGHRANIVRPQFTEIGIGTAIGTYKGKPALYVVQMFGTPAVAAAAPAPQLDQKTLAQSMLPTAILAAGDAHEAGSRFWQLALASPLAIANMLLCAIAAAAAAAVVARRGALAGAWVGTALALFAAVAIGGNTIVAALGAAVL